MIITWVSLHRSRSDIAPPPCGKELISISRRLPARLVELSSLILFYFPVFRSNIMMNVLMWQVTLSTVLTSILIITALKADTGDHAAVVSGVHGFCCALWLGTAAWGAIFQGTLTMKFYM